MRRASHTPAAHLFLGRLQRERSVAMDLLPRERLALACLAVALFVTGIWPNPIVDVQGRTFEFLKTAHTAKALP